MSSICLRFVSASSCSGVLSASRICLGVVVGVSSEVVGVDVVCVVSAEVVIGEDAVDMLDTRVARAGLFCSVELVLRLENQIWQIDDLLTKAQEVGYQRD